MPLIERVRRTLRRHQLTSASTRVVAALSGGPDSMALVHVLRALDQAGDLSLVAIAHLNHQLRDAASGDEQFCAAVAASLSLPFAVEHADVRALATAGRRSLEDAAHLARYAFFERVVASHRADVMAVGHTKDDQAETFLLRLIRGAGSRGLAAMHPGNGVVIRPLLDCSRADVHAFLDASHVAVVHDTSNDDVGIPRNRVRAELLPLLRERFNPRIVHALAAEAELARADQQYLQGLAAAWCATAFLPDTPGCWKADTQALSALPRAIASRVLHAAMSRAAGDHLVGFDAVERARALAVDGGDGFDAPGHRVERVGRYVVLTSRSVGSAGRRPTAAARQVAGFRYPLPVPGEVSVPDIGCVVSAGIAPSMADAPEVDRVTVVVAREKVADGLAVRNRRPGDRLLPSAAGHRKLQDLFVDRKVPRAERDRIPVVVDAADRIVWVVGHALDQAFRVTNPAQAVVVLRLKAVGGSF